MDDRYESFQRAARLLPGALRQRALALDRQLALETEELRLRAGGPMALTVPAGEQPLWDTQVRPEDLEQVVDAATEFSRYTAAESLRQGWLTAPGGLRLGVCGRMTETGITELSSLSIRIPCPRSGIAEPVLPQLWEEGRLCSTLLLSPPGGGKTTLLRELVRLLANGGPDRPALRVALVDERWELAAMYRGEPALDVGRQTDVLSGLPKARAVPLLLRAMNPQVIALDEIALEEDVSAVRSAAGCGAALLATVHAPSLEALARRPLGRQLLDCGVFQRAVVLSGQGAARRARVEVLP